jgi:hypothetical protein
MKAKTIKATIAGIPVEFSGSSRVRLDVDQYGSTVRISLDADDPTFVSLAPPGAVPAFMGRPIDGDLMNLIGGGWTMADVRSMLRILDRLPASIGGGHGILPLGRGMSSLDWAWNGMTERVRGEVLGKKATR